MQTLFNISFMLLYVMAGCKDTGVDPPPPIKEEKKWEEIAIFKNADIRYMTIHGNALYVSAVYHTGAVNSKDSSVIFLTTDGDRWDTLKTFMRDTGPLAFYGDTLTVLETGRIWDYHPSFGWKLKYETLIGAWITYDMFYLNNELYTFELRNKAFSKDSIREIKGISSVSKFIKHNSNGKEIAYTVPYYVYLGVPRRFDGNDFYPLVNGVSSNENQVPNYPALCVHKDTLYAGFNTPTRIKKLVNGVWENTTDTITNTKDALLFNPPLTNTASSILFYNDRMFVGTERTGILEWTGDSWRSISEGLQKQFPDHPNIEIYTPIIFLETLNGILFTGFGEPGFAPLYNGRGMYKYKLK